MSDRQPNAAQSTAVTIFGRTYHLRGDEDPQYLQLLAQRVDSRMRAILASLNLADDSLKAGGGASKPSDDTHRRLAQLVIRLDEALAGSAHRLP
jgi:hypothetical protein